MPPKLEIVAHPPERSRRGAVLLSAGSCCCCCCCLHSLGGIVGALVGGSREGRGPAPEGVTPAERRSVDRHVRKIYWLSLLAVAVLAVIGSLVEARGSDGPVVAFFVVALCLPGGQLIASVLTLIYLNTFPHPRKRETLQRLGKITLFAFLGGLIGTALMVAMVPIFK